MTSIAAYFRKLVGFQRDREKIGVRERLKLKHTFLYACSNGIIESVKECIDNGVDVNCKLGERERNYNYTFVPFPKHYKICLGDFGLMLATRQIIWMCAKYFYLIPKSMPTIRTGKTALL